MKLKNALKSMAIAGAVAALPAQAALIERDFDQENDCAGYFGDNFSSCTIFVNSMGKEIELSPVIAKYEPEDGNANNPADGDVELNNGDDAYSSIDGDEFSFVIDGDNSTGDWAYDQGDDDPGVRYWVAKAGNGFTLFWEVDEVEVETGGACDVSDVYVLACMEAANVVDEGSWTTPDTKGLSHITFYDTEKLPPEGEIPLPAAAWMFMGGLGLFGWVRRRSAQKLA